MKNRVQEGRAVYVPAPIGDVDSGDLVIIGSLIGIAGHDAAAGELVPLWTDGIYSLPKAAPQAWGVGDLVYWDAGAGKATTTAQGNTLIGVATPLSPLYEAAAASADVVGDVRLNSSFA